MEPVTPACPNCSRADAVRPLREAAAAPEHAHRLSLPPSPRHHGRSIGCGTFLISSLAGFGAGTFVGVLVMLTGLDQASRASGIDDAGIFSAILVFMIVFIGVFAGFVWRQARADAMLRADIVRWHHAQTRWEQLAYCSRCDGAFAPGQARLVPADQLHAWLLDEAQRPAPSSSALQMR